MNERQRQVPVLLAALVLVLPSCRSTEHTVARIVAPTPAPVEVEAAPAAQPATPRSTAAPVAPPATRTPTPTPASMPVVTAQPGPRSDRSPGVLYEELVPTARAVTPLPTRTATRRAISPPMQTATPAATLSPTWTATPAATPSPTRTATPAATSPPTRTATREATPVPTRTPGRPPAGPGGAYYEDEQGNPMNTPTP